MNESSHTNHLIFQMHLVFRRAAIIILISFLSACTSIGPGTIDRDQFNYSDSIGEAWKDQMLLNIIRLRYGDTPVFLEVSSVVNQYEMESEVGFSVLNGSNSTQGARASGIFIDKPTISYTPLKGDAFIRGLLTPIPPETVFSLIQADWPANLVMEMTLKSINGIRNSSGGLLGSRKADPEFKQVSEALFNIQREGGIGMRLGQLSSDRVSLITFYTPRTEMVEADIEVLRSLLDVELTDNELALVFGAVRQNDKEVAVLTRSMLDILLALSAQVTVPRLDVDEHRVTPNQNEDEPHLMSVFSGEKQPEDAFVSVRYRDHWFWIADTDLVSKRMLTVMVLLFSLVQTGDAKPVAPVLTIQAG